MRHMKMYANDQITVFLHVGMIFQTRSELALVWLTLGLCCEPATSAEKENADCQFCLVLTFSEILLAFNCLYLYS